MCSLFEQRLWEKSIPQNLTAGRQLNSIFGAFCYGRVVCVFPLALAPGQIRSFQQTAAGNGMWLGQLAKPDRLHNLITLKCRPASDLSFYHGKSRHSSSHDLTYSFSANSDAAAVAAFLRCSLRNAPQWTRPCVSHSFCFYF